jgi:oligosaccharide reducing-end xylanase
MAALLLLAVAALLAPHAAAAAAPDPRPPPRPPAVGAVTSGLYRNMFREAGYTQSAIDAKIDAAWRQLYYGDAATQRIYYEVPAEQAAYVTDVKNGDVRTEGMGCASTCRSVLSPSACRLWLALSLRLSGCKL